MISCARVYWIFHFISRSFHPRLCFIAFKMKFNYPVPSHFQFSGRDGSGTWKKVRDGSGTGIPSDPGCNCWQDVWNVHNRSKISLNIELENVVMPYLNKSWKLSETCLLRLQVSSMLLSSGFKQEWHNFFQTIIFGLNVARWNHEFFCGPNINICGHIWIYLMFHTLINRGPTHRALE